MPAKPTERQYRSLSVLLQPQGEKEERAKRIESDYYVEGYASTFDDPYVLYEHDGRAYWESVSPGAFESADMSDVIMQFDHEGRVLARTSNGTLVVEPDEHGLFVAADLSGSQSARELYEEIQSGLVTRMSWAFTIACDEYDRDTRTDTITKVKKVFDVSAVSLPADPNTEISARTRLDGEIERTRRESARRRMALAKARATLALVNVKKG